MRAMIFRTLVTNSAVNALGLINAVLLSRWMGPVGRGEIAAAFLWPGLLIYLSSMGLIFSTMYFTSQPGSTPDVILGNSMLLGLLLGGLAMVLGFVGMPWLLHSQSRIVISASRWYLIVIPLSLLSQFGIGVLQGRRQLKALNWLMTIIPVGYLGGTVLLVAINKLRLMNIVALHLGLNLGVLICTLFALARAGVRPLVRTDAALAKRMLGYGLKVHVGQVSGHINLNLDQMLIAAWLPPVSLGYYVVAVSAAGLSQILAGAVRTVAMPNIASRASSHARRELLGTIFRRYWLISVALMIAMSATIPILIPLIYGAGFRASVLPAEILIVAAMFTGAKSVLGEGAVALGDPWLISKANIIAVPVTLVLLAVLLPVWGLLGAATASATAYLVELATVIYLLRRRHSIAPSSLFTLDVSNMGEMLRLGARTSLGESASK